MRRAGLLAKAVAVACLAAPLAASAQSGSETDLRARQEALFAEMLKAPDNLDLMFEHALTSIALSDFEAAISTLERMLIFNPDLSRAKVELGAAYFRLGAYENARFYFQDVLEKDNPPPEVARRVNGFLDEIGKRTQKSGSTFVATFGGAYSTNANLGPPDRDIFVGGLTAQLNDEFTEDADFGFRTTLAGRHFIDLDQPDGDVWLTELGIFSLHYVDETRGDIDSLTFRTGPRLSLTPENFGPKIRPFVEADVVRSNNDLLYGTLGVGAEYSDTVSDEINLFASGFGAWREYNDSNRSAFDGATFRGSVGVAYSPEPELTVTGLLSGETDRTRKDRFGLRSKSNYEIGARLGAIYRYDSGLEFTERLWSVSGFVGGTYRRFDDPDLETRGTVREDYDVRAGLSHVFHLSGGWFVQADADVLVRDSNISNFDLENFGGGLSVGRAF